MADDYHTIFDYPTQFLSKMLCPQRALCHQKFELVIDDLAFIGHPVSAEDDGTWRFKSEKSKSNSRGRGSRNRDADDNKSERSVNGELRPTPQNRNSWLHMFHFVLVLDLPDPSSSASGNIAKYFHVIYNQIAFTVTAVLFQEQVLSNFVETECDVLGALEAESIAKGIKLLRFQSKYADSIRRGFLEIRLACPSSFFYCSGHENALRIYQIVINGMHHTQ